MKATRQEDKTVFASVVVSDPQLCVSLAFLINVILKREFVSLSKCSLALRAPDSVLDTNVLILCCPEEVDDSLNLIERVRKLTEPPEIIVLDQYEDPDFGGDAFGVGATDVVRPPFRLREFAFRLVSRTGIRADPGEFSKEGVSLETEALVVNEARLTTVEAQIAKVLIDRGGSIVSRDELSHAIDHRPWQYGDRKFDVHVAKIRKKFSRTFGSAIHVNTIRSAGYQLTMDTETFLDD